MNELYSKTFPEKMLTKSRVIKRKDKVEGMLPVEYANTETGEIVEAAFVQKRESVIDGEQFIKLFKHKQIDLFTISATLSKLSIRLIFYIIKNIKKEKIDIELPPIHLMTVCEQKSRDKISRALKELCAADIITRKGKRSNFYEVNPEIIFNGSRVKYMVATMQNVDTDNYKLTQINAIVAEKR